MVTRPAADAASWLRALREQGWTAQALPLLEIGEPQTDAALRELSNARTHWSQWDALMFVSGAAVAHFFAAGVAPAPGPTTTRFWAPGPGTARALLGHLRSLGIAEDRLDAPPDDAVQFDSEALWPVVRAQLGPGKKVLVVRGLSAPLEAVGEPEAKGGTGRQWLIEQCESLGAEVSACAAYERRAPLWTADTLAQARGAAAPGSVWLLSSSEALVHLLDALPGQSWAGAAALATHPRIAEVARDAGFGVVHCCRPALPDVLRALESHWSLS